MITLNASTVSGNYPVCLGAGILPEAGRLWREQGREGKVVIITDSHVAPLYVDAVASSFSAAGYPVTTITVAAGEQSKSLERAGEIYSRLYAMKIRRRDAVCALGGGIIGDLSGFVASTYMRGVGLIQIPTTLLAQVDSSVGGKTGVNITEAKNYVGTFYQPDLVVADTGTLKTLPADQLREGLAEVVKYALLEGDDFLERLEEGKDEFFPPAGEYVTAIVSRCLQYKLRVVAEDERDLGLRAVLNLGHTVGHGIEAAGNFTTYSHGQAVALGLLAAAWLSEELQGLPATYASRLEALLEGLGLPVRYHGLRPEDILGAMGGDKKADDISLNMVLLRQPGQPVTGCDVDAGRLAAVVKRLAAEPDRDG